MQSSSNVSFGRRSPTIFSRRLRNDSNHRLYPPKNESPSGSDNHDSPAAESNNRSNDPRQSSSLIADDPVEAGSAREDSATDEQEIDAASRQRQLSTDNIEIPQILALEDSTVVSGFNGTIVDGRASDDDDDDNQSSTSSEEPSYERQRDLDNIALHAFLNEVPNNAARNSFMICGVDCSRQGTQVISLAIGLLVVALIVTTLFAANVIGKRPSVVVTIPTEPHSPDVLGLRPSAQPQVTAIPTEKIVTLAPSMQPSPNPTPLDTVALLPLPTNNSSITQPTLRPTAQPVTAAPSMSSHPSMFGQWVQVGSDIDAEAPFDRSGSSVALSSNGDFLAVGAPLNDGGGVSAGHVRVYVNELGEWVQLGSDLDGAAAGDQFGYSVSLSADGLTVAVGARLADGINGVWSGQVNVYTWRDIHWSALGTSIDGEAEGDEFGTSVALSDDGTVLAAGGNRNDGGGSNAGHARVFNWTGTDWIQRGNALEGASAGDSFGDSIALSSDGWIVACGGDQWNNGSPGFVSTYRWSGLMWVQQGPTLNGTSANDEFGESVSLSGDGTVLAVGADNGNYCVVYRFNGTDWSQIGQPIRGMADGDLFGFSVSLSFTGDTVVIGGPLNGSNGDRSGHIAVYQLTSSSEWVQVGRYVVGESAGDQFGIDVSISDDGRRIAVGGTGNDGNGVSAGHVRVYDLEERIA